MAEIAAVRAGPVARVLAALAARRGQLLPWAPVLLSVGIGAYFALPAEPGLALLTLAALLLAICVPLALGGRRAAADTG